MVAKRDLSARFSPQVQRQSLRSQRQYRQNDVVSINSRSRSTLGNHAAVNKSSSYSEAVAHSVQHKRAKFCRAKAIESVVVIAVNVALSFAAVIAIAKLLPYQASQKDSLDEITTEVNSTEKRVNELRDQLPQALNSGKSQELAVRKHGWIKNNQVTVKLIDPSEIATPNTDGLANTTTTAQKQQNNLRNP
jgi:cell division protein FtsB